MHWCGIVFLSFLSFVQVPKQNLSPETQERLAAMADILTATEILQKAGGKTEAEIKQIEERILKTAAEELGVDTLTKAELVALATRPAPGGQIAGFFSFLNLIKITASLILIMAICWLFRLYLKHLIGAIPLRGWEIIAYATCVGLIIVADFVDPQYHLMFTLPGCLGFYPAVILSFCIWKDVTFTQAIHHKEFPHEGLWMVLTLIWGGTALRFDSEVLAFMSSGALVTTMGLCFGLLPGVVFLGFRDDSIVRGTVGSLVVLVAYLMGQIAVVTNNAVNSLAIFETGFVFFGAFGYYLGLLILSSKWYDNRENYWPMQAVTVVSGCLALYLGSVFGLGTLLGIGGTFFYIYLLEKYYEIPWEGKGWAWSFLGLGGILYVFVMFASEYPDYFLLIGA